MKSEKFLTGLMFQFGYDFINLTSVEEKMVSGFKSKYGFEKVEMSEDKIFFYSGDKVYVLKILPTFLEVYITIERKESVFYMLDQFTRFFEELTNKRIKMLKKTECMKLIHIEDGNSYSRLLLNDTSFKNIKWGNLFFNYDSQGEEVNVFIDTKDNGTGMLVFSHTTSFDINSEKEFKNKIFEEIEFLINQMLWYIDTRNLQFLIEGDENE